MILHGDSLERLKEFPDNYFDCIVTDPPAGISFMNKSWDSDKGGRDKWIAWLESILLECKRVLKPGAHVFIWALPRTSHWTGFAIENAGFEIRDVCTHIFGSGFPKSHNLKGEWEGWGTALKPASEHWILARKPLEKGLTVAENVLRYGTGALNIDASRIEGVPTSFPKPGIYPNSSGVYPKSSDKRQAVPSNLGRWPANVLFDEAAAEMLDEQSGPCKTGNIKAGTLQGFGKGANTYGDGVVPREFQTDAATGASRFFYVAKSSKAERSKGLNGFDCAKLSPCQSAENTEQVASLLKAISDSEALSLNIAASGESITVTCPKECKSTTLTEINRIIESKTWNSLMHSLTRDCTRDASLDQTAGISHVQSAKSLNESVTTIGISAVKAGLVTDDVKLATLEKLSKLSEPSAWQTFSSTHPTVKPLKLMEYLIKLVCPPSGIVLDPFCGSGSTGVAAKRLGFGFVGVEMNAEYVEIAQKRLENGAA